MNGNGYEKVGALYAVNRVISINLILNTSCYWQKKCTSRKIMFAKHMNIFSLNIKIDLGNEGNNITIVLRQWCLRG